MTDPAPDYPKLSTLKSGLSCTCPRCGKGPLFKGFLSLNDDCSNCGLSFAFADPADGPAFFVMSAVGLVGMILFMIFEFTVHPPVWVHAVVTAPILVAMCLGVLRPFKSWIVAEQYVHKAAPPEFSSIGKHGPY